MLSPSAKSTSVILSVKGRNTCPNRKISGVIVKPSVKKKLPLSAETMYMYSTKIYFLLRCRSMNGSTLERSPLSANTAESVSPTQDLTPPTRPAKSAW